MRLAVSLATFLLFVAAASATFAAQEPAPPAAQNPDDELQARRMMDEVRALVVPQQKDRARQMIKDFPNTRLARLAQKLLDEFQRYDDLAAAEREPERLRRERLREYWESIYPGWQPPLPEPMRITNTTTDPILYQVRGPEMEWSRPHTLRTGQSHVFRYPLILRRISNGQFIQQCLYVGVQYEFVTPAGGGDPTLIR